MQPMSRRAFLATGAAVVVAACSDSDGEGAATTSDTTVPPTTAAATSTVAARPPCHRPPSRRAPRRRRCRRVELSADPFTLGVASGDPDPTQRRVVDPAGARPARTVAACPTTTSPSRGRSATRPDFATIVATGVETATAAHGHTVHAVGRDRPRDLVLPVPCRSVHEPGRHDSRRSGRQQADARHSDVRRRRTARTTPTAVRRAPRSRRAHTGFRRLPRRLHLRGPGPAPTPIPHSACTSAPSRRRSTTIATGMRRYKTDPHLQAAHAACPWFVIWDDHEVENNYAGLDTAGSRRCADLRRSSLRCVPGVVGAPTGASRTAGRRRPGVPHLSRDALGRS